MTETTAAEEEKARQDAEARRRRILEKADGRMDSVSGLAPKPTDGETAAAASSSDQPVVETVSGDDVAAEGGEEAAAAAASPVPKKSAAAKMAAMRRRRFKKGAKKEESSEAGEAEAAVTETPAPAPVAASEVEVRATGETQPVETAPAPAPAEISTEEPEETKKKYVGVAKMRRKMIKEKQQQKSSAEADASGDTTATVEKPKIKLRKKKKTLVDTLPIFMHMITVLLLFFAGLDVGLQQGKHSAQTTVMVHHDLTVATRMLQLPSSLSSKATPDTMITTDSSARDAIAEEDEFTVPGDDLDLEENLDPLFHVDLDKLTAGPGPVMYAARWAVYFHRLLLTVLYYWPVQTLAQVFELFYAIVRIPPVFCLVALVVRQVIGRMVLGAKLPDKDTSVEDEILQNKDILNNIKQFVTTFVQRSFPTAFTLYDMFTALRADLYIVACGLLVGLALNHPHPAATGDALSSSLGVPDVDLEPPPVVPKAPEALVDQDMDTAADAVPHEEEEAEPALTEESDESTDVEEESDAEASVEDEEEDALPDEDTEMLSEEGPPASEEGAAEEEAPEEAVTVGDEL